MTILEERSKIKNEHVIGYYTIDDLVKKLQISSGTIYGEISKDTFPKQIKIGVRNSLWCKKEMHAWMVINASRGREYILNKKWSNIYAERYALKF